MNLSAFARPQWYYAKRLGLLSISRHHLDGRRGRVREYAQKQRSHSVGLTGVSRQNPKLNRKDSEAGWFTTESSRFGHDFSKIPTHPLNSVQSKAITNEPGDEYEREADRVADHVLNTLGPEVKGGHPPYHNEHSNRSPKKIQTGHVQTNQAGEMAAPTGVREALNSSGAPLDAKTQTLMESSFGHDFSRIRVHADARAGDSACALGARAYTAGRDIVFGTGQFAPETPEGRRLLAHELVHVLQQRAAPASSDAAIATSRASGVVQRQPTGGTATPAKTPEENVKEAINLLQNVQPPFIHKALSAAPVNGGSVQVHSLQHASGGKPVTSVFTLELKVAPLPGFKRAEFQAQRTPTIAGGTRTFAMTITVNNNAANSPPQTLARDLFHEGMHMQLYIDRAVPSWSSTLYLKGFQDYLATVSKLSIYQDLLSKLTKFIKKHAKGKTPTLAASEAKEIVEQIMEEKYVVDLTEQSGPGSQTQPSTPPTPSEKRRQYLTLTTRWLGTYLQQVGVKNGPQDEIGRMAAMLSALWSEIDDKAPRPPRYPVPIGKYAEPDILPKPSPAPL